MISSKHNNANPKRLYAKLGTGKGPQPQKESPPRLQSSGERRPEMKAKIELPISYATPLTIEKEIPSFLRENDYITIHEIIYTVMWSSWNTDKNRAFIRLKPENIDPEAWANMKADGWK